jgi:hypothetical protein
MAKKRQNIKMDEWYTAEEATAKLSENSGRPISRDYPRELARAGKVESIEIGARGKLYRKIDIDTYQVGTTRGRRKKTEKPAA